MTSATTKPPNAPAVKAGSRFRPDIQGLRAVAVGLVLLYHAGLALFPGGYVGVDVFFVISGFLITGMLVRQAEEPCGFLRATNPQDSPCRNSSVGLRCNCHLACAPTDAVG